MESFLLNPLMLWGMALFLVPLLIHLLSRRRYRRIRWAAMDFLLAAYKRTRRRLRLENLLLLLVRCLLPVLFALAAARPYLSPESPLAMLAESANDTILVCDVSYSMGRRTGVESCLDRARAQMRQLLSSLDFEGGDSATLMTLAERPARLSTRLDRADVHAQRIDALANPTYEGADLLKTLQYLRDEVVPQIPGAKNVFIFSDLQRCTFVPESSAEPSAAEGGGDIGPAAVMRSLKNQGIHFYLVDTSGASGAIDNLLVESVAVVERTPMANQAVTLVGTVKNVGTVSRRGASGTFFIDGERSRTVSLDLEPGGKATGEITHVFRHDGFHSVELRLEEDDLLADDTGYLALAVRGRIPVLLVDGDWRQDDEWSSETGRIGLMLDPLEDATSERGSPFTPHRIPYHRLNSGRESLTDYNLVVLANVPAIAEDVVEALASFVKNGGGLLVFLGDKVEVESYNARLWHADQSGLLPWRLIAPKGAAGESFYTLKVDDFSHPVLAPFTETSITRYLTAPPTFRFFVLEESPSEGVEVLARWNDDPNLGSPAIVECRRDEGRVMLVTTSADADWTLLPESKGFLPLVHELAYYLTVKSLAAYNVRVATPLRRSLSSIPREASITLPSGERRRIEKLPQKRVEGLYPLDLSDVPTDQPGIYRLDGVLLGSPSGVEEQPMSELFAVNVDPREGDVTPARPGELAAVYEGLIEATVSDVSELVRPKEEARRGEIFKALLAALLAFTVVETLLAHLFGRRQ
ncbi:MAG: BatA domain-containing protein [Planctomycetota bacterium]